jgi:hypothetical protein
MKSGNLNVLEHAGPLQAFYTKSCMEEPEFLTNITSVKCEVVYGASKLVAGLSKRKPDVNCTQFYVGFVVDKSSLNESVFSILRFPLSIWIPPVSHPYSFIYLSPLISDVSN